MSLFGSIISIRGWGEEGLYSAYCKFSLDLQIYFHCYSLLVIRFYTILYKVIYFHC